MELKFIFKQFFVICCAFNFDYNVFQRHFEDLKQKNRKNPI